MPKSQKSEKRAPMARPASPKKGRASSTRSDKSVRSDRAGRSRAHSGAPKVRSAKSIPRPSLPRWKWRSISSERKLDILGIILGLVGLISLLSLLSSEHSSLTGWWVDTLFRTAGWGAFVLPVGFILIGLWLVFRNVEKLPLLSPERLVGFVLLYVNVLAWLHLAAGGGWFLAAAGRGGGYLGAVFERAFVTGLGPAAAVIAFIAWLVVSLLLAFDLSIPEGIRKLQALTAHAQRAQAAPQYGAGTETIQKPLPHMERAEQASVLPSTFRSLDPISTRTSPVPEQNSKTQAQPIALAEVGEPAAVPTAGFTAEPRSTQSEIPPPAAVDWVLPNIEEILDAPAKLAIQAGRDEDRAHLIEETLASFGAPAHVVEIHRGPTVTQFGVEPDFVSTRTGRVRVRVSKIVSLADDLALALAAPRIRIQAPVPGRNYVGIEVPNTEISRVTLREGIESESFQKIRSKLRFALGKDVAGKPTSVDLTGLPHLLIAGTTGSGKSVCVNAILSCLLLDNTPNDLRLVLVDPKRVELTGYNGIPHLLAPVVVDAEKVIGALQWMLREMDSRYHKFSQNGARNIVEFNERFPEQKLPYLVIVVDELADLMMLAPDETERSITRLAQLARATGIHLILATQRPSVDVVTGLIKANFPARIAFTVASGVDSRVILDQPGAERLLGRGDMLYQSPEASAPVRLQGAFVSDHEIQRLVDYWQAAARPAGTPTTVHGGPIDAVPNGVPLRQVPLWDTQAAQDTDPMLTEAIDLVRREGRASITMLQRRLRIGYTRAARMVDAMETQGIIGPPQPNSQVREVLDYGQAAPPPEEP